METKVIELDLNDVLPNRFQPRIKFSQESIQDLANSIKEHGVIQPIVVRCIGDKYEIIAGERRYKASVLAGKQTIPAIITDLSEKDSAEVALIENIQRKDLTPIEEAISYKKILDMGYLTQEDLANKLGKTQSTIANKLRLLNLDDDVQEALLNEQISERHARSLLKINNQNQQKEILKRIVNERLTVRKTDEEIDKMLNNNDNSQTFQFNQPQEINNNTAKKSIEELEVFNPNIETLNIPTAPIIDDSIPEVLPIEPSNESFKSTFNPQPEIINAGTAPITEPNFNSNINQSLNTTNQPVEELTFESQKVPDLNTTTGPIQEEILQNIDYSTPKQDPAGEINTFGNNINPGFMDINKIEKEATNIYNEKPLAPVDNLLEPSSIEPTPVYTEPDDEEEGTEDILVPGKFFNLMSEEEKDEEKKEPINNDSFNFNLDINSLNNIENTNNLPGIEEISTVSPIEPTENKEQIPNNVDNTQIHTIEPQPIINPLNNYDSIHENPVPVEPDSSLYQDSIAELELPEVKMDTASVEENNNKPASNVYEEVPIVHPTNNKVDLKTAINMIRDFSDNLSKIGYIIDTEEFDFEDMYQVIFKINK